MNRILPKFCTDPCCDHFRCARVRHNIPIDVLLQIFAHAGVFASNKSIYERRATYYQFHPNRQALFYCFCRLGLIGKFHELLNYPDVDASADSGKAIRVASANGQDEILYALNSILKLEKTNAYDASVIDGFINASANGHYMVMMFLMKIKGEPSSDVAGQCFQNAYKNYHDGVVGLILDNFWFTPNEEHFVMVFERGNLQTLQHLVAMYKRKISQNSSIFVRRGCIKIVANHNNDELLRYFTAHFFVYYDEAMDAIDGLLQLGNLISAQIILSMFNFNSTSNRERLIKFISDSVDADDHNAVGVLAPFVKMVSDLGPFIYRAIRCKQNAVAEQLINALNEKRKFCKNDAIRELRSGNVEGAIRIIETVISTNVFGDD